MAPIHVMSRQREEPGVLDRVVRWAAARDDVRAVLLTGSRAAPEPAIDRFSDSDVILYVTDPAALAQDSAWLGGFGDVLVRFDDELQEDGVPYHMRLVLYADGTKVDFTVTSIEQLDSAGRTGECPDRLDLGYRVLLDKDGRAAALPPPTFTAHIPRRPTEQEFLALVEEFWWESTYVAKNLARGELLPAKYSLDSVMRLDLLRRMLEWRVETEHGWSLRPGVWGRGLRGHLDAATWAELEATFAGADIEANWRALFDMIRLFRRVAGEVADRIGLRYPDDLDARMMEYLERIRSSGR